jgi:hypothetical protein
VQAVMVVLAGVVAPVGLSGAALGGDESAVDQDYLSALPGDLLQGMVQSRRLRGQDDYRDLPGRQNPPPGPDHLQVTSQQIGEVVDGARGQRKAALVDKQAGVLGVLSGFRHTNPTAAGGTVQRCSPGIEATTGK